MIAGEHTGIQVLARWNTIFRSRLTQNVVDQATPHLRYHCILYAGKMHSETSEMLRDKVPVEEVSI